MAKITLYLGFNSRNLTDISLTPIRISSDIDEVQLKATLRDMGFIPSYPLKDYQRTRLFLLKENKDLVSIGLELSRSFEELGIVDESIIILDVYETQMPTYNFSSFGGKCLYGCPMSKRVQATVDAENYSITDSVVESHIIHP